MMFIHKCFSQTKYGYLFLSTQSMRAPLKWTNALKNIEMSEKGKLLVDFSWGSLILVLAWHPNRLTMQVWVFLCHACICVYSHVFKYVHSYYLRFNPCIYHSIYLPIYRSIHLSIYIYIYLSIYMPI